MRNISTGLADHFLAKGFISDSDRDIYVYGAEILLNTITFFITSLILGILTGRVMDTLIIFAVFMPVRSLVGGYHAASGEKCLVISLAVMYAIMVAYPHVSVLPAAGMVAFSNWVVFMYAPVLHAHCPHSFDYRKVLRKRARMLAVCVTVIIVALYPFSMGIAALVSTTYFCAAISAWLVILSSNES